jgi:phage regulator Rha-like protein
MNIVNFGAEVRTMTSREIAELTGKQHRNVLADIRVMLADLGLTSTDFSADLPDSYGRMQPGFQLPKRETLILVSGYSIPMRARIVDRWEALETGKAKPAKVRRSNFHRFLGHVKTCRAFKAQHLRQSISHLNSLHCGRIGLLSFVAEYKPRDKRKQTG